MFSQHPMFLHCDSLCHLLLDHKPKGTNVSCAEALSKHVLSGRKEELEKKRGKLGDEITGERTPALTCCLRPRHAQVLKTSQGLCSQLPKC